MVVLKSFFIDETQLFFLFPEIKVTPESVVSTGFCGDDFDNHGRRRFRQKKKTLGKITRIFYGRRYTVGRNIDRLLTLKCFFFFFSNNNDKKKFQQTRCTMNKYYNIRSRACKYIRFSFTSVMGDGEVGLVSSDASAIATIGRIFFFFLIIFLFIFYARIRNFFVYRIYIYQSQNRKKIHPSLTIFQSIYINIYLDISISIYMCLHSVRTRDSCKKKLLKSSFRVLHNKICRFNVDVGKKKNDLRVLMAFLFPLVKYMSTEIHVYIDNTAGTENIFIFYYRIAGR